MNNLAFLYAEQAKNLDEALVLAKKAAGLVKGNGAMQDTLGWVYYQRGQLDEAEITLKAAVALEPKHPAIRYHLGLLYLSRGRKGEARGELKRALELGRFAGDASAQKILKELGG